METDEFTHSAQDVVSDEELLRRVTRGEQGALRHLYGRHGLLLRKIILQCVGDFCDAEEVLQDVFVTVWNRAGTYKASQGKPLGWVICVARRRAIDHLRRDGRRRTSHIYQDWNHEDDPAEDRLLPGFSWKSEEARDAWDLRQHLADLMAQLPVEQRRVLDLTYFGQLSQRQIAAQTGIPLGTIKTRLTLAHQKLLQMSQHLRPEVESR